jgi:hypothetical protein
LRYLLRYSRGGRTSGPGRLPDTRVVSFLSSGIACGFGFAQSTRPIIEAFANVFTTRITFAKPFFTPRLACGWFSMDAQGDQGKK